jgi:hypothetical protein
VDTFTYPDSWILPLIQIPGYFHSSRFLEIPHPHLKINLVYGEKKLTGKARLAGNLTGFSV